MAMPHRHETWAMPHRHGQCRTAAPILFLFRCSLDNNALCGVDGRGNGTYTTEGIVALMEGVKDSSIQSLR